MSDRQKELIISAVAFLLFLLYIVAWKFKYGW